MILSIAEQHAGNTAFLWMLRDGAAVKPHYTLADLATLDRRVEAHVDGLRVAGDLGWEVCEAALRGGEAGEVFAATLLAAERQDVPKIAAVLDAIDEGGRSPALLRGMLSALGWTPFDVVSTMLPAFLDPACPPALHYLGIGACALHRHDPGAELVRAITAEDARVRRRAMDAAGELGRKDLCFALERAAEHDTGELRLSAARAALLLGSQRVASTLHEIGSSTDPAAPHALSLAVRLGDSKTSGGWLQTLAGQKETVRNAVIAAGALGDPALVPWLLGLLAVPELARVAGEAFSFITGVDLEEEDLGADPPEGFESGPNDDPRDDDVVEDPDGDLLWPDPKKLEPRWMAVRDTLAPGTRHLFGKPISAGWAEHVLHTGRQRLRAAAAVELSLLSPGRALFEVRAPAPLQLASLRVAP